MFSFGQIVAGIGAFTALAGYVFMTVMPFGLGQFSLTIVIIKVAAIACWVAAAWRVKKRRDKAFIRKTRDGTLWTGPIDEANLGIPLKDLEVIRYHFDADEKIARIFRRHKIVLWQVPAHLGVALLLVAISYLLAKYYPAIEPPKGVPEDQTETAFNTVWWIPLIPVAYLVHQGLRAWQEWKWTIRIITDRNVYLIREQSVYMPWTGKLFRPIANHQIIAISNMSESISGMVGWGNLDLTVRADEHDDQPEHVIVDYVPDDDECERQLRDMLPVYQQERSSDQVAGGESTGISKKRGRVVYKGLR